MDDLENKQQQIQAELSGEGVSRRGFMDRLKVLGVGFGAAFLLGAKGAEARIADTASLKSSNPAIDAIIGGDKKEHEAEGEKLIQEAWYRRFYRRFYHRWGGGGGYRRFYRRW